LVGVTIPTSSGGTVLNDERRVLSGTMQGAAAVDASGLLQLSAAGDYVSLPVSGLGTSKGFTLTVTYTPIAAATGTKQVLMAFGDASTSGLELGVSATGFPYVANRGQNFTSASAVTSGARATTSVVCAANRVYCFLV
jgi:hypothetical protein